MNSQYPFGTKLGCVTIDGTEIDVFSNGECSHVSDARSFDRDGNYMGIQYQCVEFVRRYIYLRHGVNLAMLWQEGNACDWYDNHQTMNLTPVPLSEVRAGDVATFTGGQWGHVAVVSAVSGDTVHVAQQNFMNAPIDVNFPLPQEVLSAQVPVQDGAGNPIRFQSFLRSSLGKVS